MVLTIFYYSTCIALQCVAWKHQNSFWLQCARICRLVHEIIFGCIHVHASKHTEIKHGEDQETENEIDEAITDDEMDKSSLAFIPKDGTHNFLLILSHCIALDCIFISV